MNREIVLNYIIYFFIESYFLNCMEFIYFYLIKKLSMYLKIKENLIYKFISINNNCNREISWVWIFDKIFMW